MGGQTRINGNLARLVSKARHRRRILVARFEAAAESSHWDARNKLKNVDSLPRGFIIKRSNASEQNGQPFMNVPTPIMIVHCNDTKTTDSIDNLQQIMRKRRTTKQHTEK